MLLIFNVRTRAFHSFARHAATYDATYDLVGSTANRVWPRWRFIMWLILLLFVLAAVFVGLGFAVKWLFILAVVFAIAAVIVLLAGRSRRRSSV